MPDNRPPRRPVYGRGHAAARTPDDRERRVQARRAADALFAPKPPVPGEPVDQSARQPAKASPPARSEVMEAMTSPTTPRPMVPASHIERIRTWVKYGMTVAQVAAIYGAEADEITRLLRKV